MLIFRIIEDLAAHVYFWHPQIYTHTNAVIPPTGDIVSVYRKSHLFDVELPDKGVSLKESAFTIPGPSLVAAVQTPIGKVPFYFVIIIKLTYKDVNSSYKVICSKTYGHKKLQHLTNL